MNTTAHMAERALDRYTHQLAEEERVQAALDRAFRLEEARLLGLTVAELLGEQDTIKVRVRDVASERSISGAGDGMGCTLDLRAVIGLIAERNAAEDTKVADWQRRWGDM